MTTGHTNDKGAVKRLTSNKMFRRMWIGQFVSGIGDWLIVGILVPTVSALSGGSSAAVAGILIAKIIPALFLSSFTGALVDRFDRRKIMLWADIARMCWALFLITTNALWAIYGVVLLMETASLFFWPARNALIPALVGADDVKVANGFMYTTQQGAMIVGLAASGAILAGFEWLVDLLVKSPLYIKLTPFADVITPILVGSRAGYVVNALTFVFSAAMIMSLRSVSAQHVRSTEKFSLRALGSDALDSFRFLRSQIELRGLLVTVFFAIVGGGAIVPVGLDFINHLGGSIPLSDRVAWLAQFSGSRQTFVMTFMALGMVSGALLVPRIERRLSVRLLFPLSAALFGLGMVGFCMTDSYFVACLYAIGAGFCIAALTVAGNNYIVSEVANELRGRVFTALESVIRVSLLISMTVTAPLSDALGAIVRSYLENGGVKTLFGLALTGPRLTLLISASIVLSASVYGYRTLYLRPRKVEADQHSH